MNVGKYIPEIRLVIYMTTLISSLTHYATVSVPCVEIHWIRSTYLTHKCLDTVVRLLSKDYMEVIGHQAIWKNADKLLVSRLIKNLEWLLPVIFHLQEHAQVCWFCIICQMQKQKEALIITRLIKYWNLVGTSIKEMIILPYSKQLTPLHTYSI